MRTFLISWVFSLIALSSFSQNSGLLTYFTEDGQKFWVILNGEKINQEASYVVKDIPVSSKYGKVKIIFEEDFPPVDKNFQVVDVDENWCHVKYMIKKNKRGVYDIRLLDATYEVLGPGLSATQTPATTTVPSTSTPPPATPAATSPTATTHTTTHTTITETPAGVGSNVDVQVTDPVTGQPVTMGINVQINDPATVSSGTVQTTTTQTTNITTSGTGVQAEVQPVEQAPAHYVMPGYTGRIGCPWPMSAGDFGNLKKSIAAKSFEDSKLTLAKQAASANCLFCSQVKEIMTMLTFESSRLEFARFAYDHTYDIGNYYLLNDAFTFESSIDELNTYIQSRR